jgi:hypothetical protein
VRFRGRAAFVGVIAGGLALAIGASLFVIGSSRSESAAADVRAGASEIAELERTTRMTERAIRRAERLLATASRRAVQLGPEAEHLLSRSDTHLARGRELLSAAESQLDRFRSGDLSGYNEQNEVIVDAVENLEVAVARVDIANTEFRRVINSIEAFYENARLTLEPGG